MFDPNSARPLKRVRLRIFLKPTGPLSKSAELISGKIIRDVLSATDFSVFLVPALARDFPVYGAGFAYSIIVRSAYGSRPRRSTPAYAFWYRMAFAAGACPKSTILRIRACGPACGACGRVNASHFGSTKAYALSGRECIDVSLQEIVCRDSITLHCDPVTKRGKGQVNKDWRSEEPTAQRNIGVPEKGVLVSCKSSHENRRWEDRLPERLVRGSALEPFHLPWYATARKSAVFETTR